MSQVTPSIDLTLISPEDFSNYLNLNSQTIFKRRDKENCPLTSYLRHAYKRKDIWATGIGIQVGHRNLGEAYAHPVWMSEFMMMVDWGDNHLTLPLSGYEALAILIRVASASPRWSINAPNVGQQLEDSSNVKSDVKSGSE